MINPTLKKSARAKSHTQSGYSPVHAGERDEKEKPAITHKFSAYVEKRRKDMESKKNAEEVKFQDEVNRFFKQNRLAQRVKCSPALVSNANELKKRKKQSLRKAKQKNMMLERAWAD